MRKFTLTVIVALTAWQPITLHAQWIQKKDLDTSGRTDAISFALEGKIYVGGGRDGSNGFQDFWRYDPATDKWARKADFLHFAYKGAVAFTIGNKGYIGTGERGSGGFYPSTEFYEYDPANNKWTQKASLFSVFASERTQALGFSINGKGYIGGGYTVQASQGGGSSVTSTLDDIFEYDPDADKWTYKTTIPRHSLLHPGISSGIAAVVGNYAYIGMGCDGEAATSYSEFYRYDPAANKWDTLTPLPASIAEATAFTIGADVFVVGGNAFPSPTGTTTCWRYNTLTNKWSTDASFPKDVTAAVASVVEGRAYMGTGTNDFFDSYNNTGNSNKDWWEFKPAAPATVGQVLPAPDIAVFPNPATDEVRISIRDGAAQGIYHVAMNDLTGRQVFVASFSTGNRQAEIVIPLSAIVKGYYTVIVTDSNDNMVKVEKIIKL